MKKCYLCDEPIFDDSRNYRKRLDDFRERYKDKDVDVCDKCLKKYSKAREMAIEAEMMNRIFNKVFGGRNDI